MRIFFIALLGVLVGCTSVPKETSTEETQAPLVLKQVSFSALPNWGSDDFKTFAPAFAKSCARILKGSADKQMGALKEAGTYGDWQPVCRSFANVAPQNLKAFFENRFTPYEVRAGNEAEGLFTGYYEASLKGASARGGPYQTPLYKRPDDLVMVQLGDFRDHLKGERIAGRVIGGNLKPYEPREKIVAGQWPHNDKPLVWVDDPIDAFFVQIQGSGVVSMNDGSALRIGYAGQNGHVYYAIGRELIKRGELTKENVSLQSIRDWLHAHPDEADALMNTNASYVFFQELEGEGPIGGEGVALTGGRSLAVDHSLMAYGMPIWADIAAPVEGANKINRMMVAQDTGGAIRGPVRGDVFWGYGPQAETLAGAMKSKGRYWVLLPN